MPGLGKSGTSRIKLFRWFMGGSFNSTIREYRFHRVKLRSISSCMQTKSAAHRSAPRTLGTLIVSRGLKNVLQSELNHARVHAGSRNPTPVRRVHVHQHRWSGSGVSGWIAELRVVEQIKELRAALQDLALPNLRGLQQGSVKVELAWAR